MRAAQFTLIDAGLIAAMQKFANSVPQSVVAPLSEVPGAGGTMAVRLCIPACSTAAVVCCAGGPAVAACCAGGTTAVPLRIAGPGPMNAAATGAGAAATVKLLPRARYASDVTPLRALDAYEDCPGALLTATRPPAA